jgi:hypothetical protein
MKNIFATLCAVLFLSTTLFSQEIDYSYFEKRLHDHTHTTEMVETSYQSLSNSDDRYTRIRPIRPRPTIQNLYPAKIDFSYASNDKTIIQISSIGEKNSFVVESFKYEKQNMRGNNIYKSTAYNDSDVEYKITLEVVGKPKAKKVSVKITLQNQSSGESNFYY